MADIVLADMDGQGWLVVGQQYIDQLLFNNLPAHLIIEVVPCESKSDVEALCRTREGANDPDELWMIHPGILKRARGQAGGTMTIGFQDWSALLDQAAIETLHSAAGGLAARAGDVLALVLHLAEDAPPMAADLMRLRAGLIEAKLAALGVAPERIAREVTTPADADQANQVRLSFRPAPAG